VLLLYFPISAAILLFGAEINAETYRVAEGEGIVNEGRSGSDEGRPEAPLEEIRARSSGTASSSADR